VLLLGTWGTNWEHNKISHGIQLGTPKSKNPKVWNPPPLPFVFMFETETEISGFIFLGEKRQEIRVNQRLIDN